MWPKMWSILSMFHVHLRRRCILLHLDGISWKYQWMAHLLLSHFSRVRLCVTPAAHQAPPSLGFFRQEHWSGLPFPSPVHNVKCESEVAQSCLTLSDPMDCSPPGSSVHGIFQARVLEWSAIAFSDGSSNVSYKTCVSLFSVLMICPLVWVRC